VFDGWPYLRWIKGDRESAVYERRLTRRPVRVGYQGLTEKYLGIAVIVSGLVLRIQRGHLRTLALLHDQIDGGSCRFHIDHFERFGAWKAKLHLLFGITGKDVCLTRKLDDLLFYRFIKLSNRTRWWRCQRGFGDREFKRCLRLFYDHESIFEKLF